ncbi:hypothetical protein [Photobacterium sp. R1]
MFIKTAKSTDLTLNNYQNGVTDSQQVEFIFKIHRDAMQFYLDNRNAQPTSEQYQEAALHIAETTGVIVSQGDVANILSLFPSARIKLAVYQGCSDTEVRELIYQAACAFFAASEAPTYGDSVDIDRFIGHLQSQAKLMGYDIDPLFNNNQ